MKRFATLQQVVTEGVVGGQAVPLLALDQAVAQQRLPGRDDVHAVRRLGVEHVAVARLAAQLVRIAAGVEEQDPVALRDLRDREARCRADLADDRDHLVALDQALRLGRCGLRIDAVFGDQVDLAAVDAAARIDFFNRQVHAHHGVLAERAEKTGQRCQMAEAYRVGLAADDGRKSDRPERARRRRAMQKPRRHG